MGSEKMNTFSIIIPTYNSEETLAVSLDSIARQSYKNVEVLIMDGQSTDNTLEIAEAFKTQIPGLKMFQEKDDGIYDAMNKGINKASGEWFFFMGSDDRFFDENVLETIAGFIETTRAMVIYGSAKIEGDTGWAKDGEIYAGEFDLHKLLNQNICHQAMFYNRAFVKDEIGEFSLEYKKSSDWDFNLRCWAKQDFEYIDMIIACFAAGGFSTHSNDTRIIEDFVDNVLKYFRIDPFHPLVNNPTFIFYPKVVKIQKADHPLRFKFERLKDRIINKLKRN
jgi:glycosyltransferase involved in cell wall biosynthesis